MLDFLKCCAASVADQEGAVSQHIVVDGNSNDGSAKWLKQHPHIKSIREKDNGMYDAVNKGLKMADGEILAYLNCDEQYLPGTLAAVKYYFHENPEVDIVFGDALLTRPNGSLIAFRKGYTPRWRYILASHLYVLSCTMFFRRKVLDDGFCFDTRFKAVGDMDFVVRLLRQGYSARHIKRYFSAFTMTGENLSADPRAVKEWKELLLKAPLTVRWGKWLLNLGRLTEKLLSGAYFQKTPLEYSLYPARVIPAEGVEPERRDFRANKASSRWRFQ